MSISPCGSAGGALFVAQPRILCIVDQTRPEGEVYACH